MPPRPPSFVPGQRFTSETEPELGVGQVVNIDERSIIFLFPAAEATRTYAMASAPVRRVRFRVGDTLRTHTGDEREVTDAAIEEGLITYQTDAGPVPETELDVHLVLHGPRNRLLAGHTDGPDPFTLRAQARVVRGRWAASPARGFSGARIALLPHQLYIAQEVANRIAPRVLLADEVGLGKTIEAGLILHRLLRSGRIQRALIVVPEALINQWFVELLRRFNISFRIFDAARLQQWDPTDADHENPFMQESLVLTSAAALLGTPSASDALLEAPWDMVIVDEAHHLGWKPNAPSPEYALVERLGERSPALLLLTATPEQLGIESHFARLRLLDPKRYFDLDQFRAESATYRDTAAQAALLEAQGDESTLSDLLERHGPGRVMFRNTRARLQGFPKRIPHLAPLNSAAKDPKFDWLLSFIKDHPGEKALLITHDKRDVIALDKRLRRALEIDTALFHEDLPLIKRDRQAAWFAEPEGARLLLASEIGGEGRNFQFAHHLILYDLPHDPEVLEQRIGRLDRIGQTSNIYIHVPFVEGSSEETLARWYHEGLQAFSHAIQGGRQFRAHFDAHMHEDLETLIAQAKTYRTEVEAELEAGRDRLLELASFREEPAAAIVSAVQAVDNDPVLPRFLETLCDRFGVLIDRGDDQTAVLKPGPLFHDGFPLPRAEGVTVTWDRALALERDDLTFVSWDHPMIQSSIDLLQATDPGTAAFAHCPNTQKRGVILEALFVIECPAPPSLHTDRFLAPTPLMIRLNQQAEPCDAPPEGRLIEGDAHAVIDHQVFRETLFPKQLAAASAQANAQADQLKTDALAVATEQLNHDIDRLNYLRSVNDHVRPEEIAALEAERTRILEALSHAAPRLDALRVVLLTP